MPDSSRCPHPYAPCPFCPETQVRDEVEVPPALAAAAERYEKAKRDKETCPQCGERSLDWEEVDVGVGVIEGPAHCTIPTCGYDAEDTVRAMLGGGL